MFSPKESSKGGTKRHELYRCNYSKMADINSTISKITLNMNTGMGKSPKKWRLRKLGSGALFSSAYTKIWMIQRRLA